MASSSASDPDLAALNASFRRTLRAQNKSDRTVEAYTEAVRLLADFPRFKLRNDPGPAAG